MYIYIYIHTCNVSHYIRVKSRHFPLNILTQRHCAPEALHALCHLLLRHRLWTWSRSRAPARGWVSHGFPHGKSIGKSMKNRGKTMEQPMRNIETQIKPWKNVQEKKVRWKNPCMFSITFFSRYGIDLLAFQRANYFQKNPWPKYSKYSSECEILYLIQMSDLACLKIFSFIEHVPLIEYMLHLWIPP